MLPETPRGRLEWAIKESLVILGILLFWVGVVVAVSLVLTILMLPFQLLDTVFAQPLIELTRLSTELWAGVLPLTFITASLYVLARVGSLLVEYYSETTRR